MIENEEQAAKTNYVKSLHESIEYIEELIRHSQGMIEIHHSVIKTETARIAIERIQLEKFTDITPDNQQVN